MKGPEELAVAAGAGTPPAGLGIGAVSLATGIPADTIRTWERRYGVPAPARTGTGQRVYGPEVVPRLRLVLRAAQVGIRPSQSLRMDLETLRGLVRDSVPRTRSGDPSAADRGPEADDEPEQPPPTRGGAETPARLRPGIEAAASFDGGSLDRWVELESRSRTAVDLMDGTLAPLLECVGEGWAEGALSVAQEHFVSEHLRAFLSRYWRSLASGSDGPVIVCTTLPDDQHQLGLHMVASILALAGCRVLFLGASTPVPDIAEAAERSGAIAVVVSVSAATEPASAGAQIELLAATLNDGCRLLFGGAGAPASASGAWAPGSLDELLRWARALS